MTGLGLIALAAAVFLGLRDVAGAIRDLPRGRLGRDLARTFAAEFAAASRWKPFRVRSLKPYESGFDG